MNDECVPVKPSHQHTAWRIRLRPNQWQQRVHNRRRTTETAHVFDVHEVATTRVVRGNVRVVVWLPVLALSSTNSGFRAVDLFGRLVGVCFVACVCLCVCEDSTVHVGQKRRDGRWGGVGWFRNSVLERKVGNTTTTKTTTAHTHKVRCQCGNEERYRVVAFVRFLWGCQRHVNAMAMPMCESQSSNTKMVFTPNATNAKARNAKCQKVSNAKCQMLNAKC